MLRWLPCACSLALAAVPAMACACSDLALVLAVDSSGSVDADEFALQTRGFAAAFRDPAVHHALAAAGVVDVAAVFWSDPGATAEVLPWHRVVTPGDADAFAAAIEDCRTHRRRHRYWRRPPRRAAPRSAARLHRARRHQPLRRRPRLERPEPKRRPRAGAGARRRGGRRRDDQCARHRRRRAGPRRLLPRQRHHRPRRLRDGGRGLLRLRRGGRPEARAGNPARTPRLAGPALATAATDAPFPQRPLGLNRPDRSPQDAP